MRLLPRSFEYRSGDTAESVGTRLAIWTRDVIAAFKRIPDVTYIEVPVASGGSADVESGSGGERYRDGYAWHRVDAY